MEQREAIKQMRELGRKAVEIFPSNFFARWSWMLGQLEERPELREYMLYSNVKEDAAVAEQMTAAGELQ